MSEYEELLRRTTLVKFQFLDHCFLKECDRVQKINWLQKDSWGIGIGQGLCLASIFAGGISLFKEEGNNSRELL